jgi:hypothetical protein
MKDPIRNLRSGLELGISRAWESLTEGWREVLTRSSGALTHVVRAAKREKSTDTHQEFPQWALLAGESWETAHSVIVRIEMPGMSKEDIDVSIYRGRLRVRGEKRRVVVERAQGSVVDLALRRQGRAASWVAQSDAAALKLCCSTIRTSRFVLSNRSIVLIS